MKRPGLNRARIVAKAVELADRDGLDAVTLRRLSTDLGVHVTSLYNHVETKEAVLDGMMEQLIAEASLPTSAIAWEDWVRRFASAIRAIARRHPGAFDVFHHRPVQGPEASASAEAALAAFRSAGFDVVEAYNAVKATTHAVLGVVLEDRADMRTPGLRTDVDRLPLARFPNLHAASALSAKADPWDYLIEALIAGFAANHSRAVVRERQPMAGRRVRKSR